MEFYWKSHEASLPEEEHTKCIYEQMLNPPLGILNTSKIYLLIFTYDLFNDADAIWYYIAAFLKLWSADHKWSSGSALVVLLDWTLVQKRQKK